MFSGPFQHHIYYRLVPSWICKHAITSTNFTGSIAPTLTTRENCVCVAPYGVAQFLENSALSQQAAMTALTINLLFAVQKTHLYFVEQNVNPRIQQLNIPFFLNHVLLLAARKQFSAVSVFFRGSSSQVHEHRSASGFGPYAPLVCLYSFLGGWEAGELIHLMALNTLNTAYMPVMPKVSCHP